MKIAMNCLAAVALFLLTALAFELRELSHHFFGWAVCGHLGSVTFAQFAVAEGCGAGPTRVVELFGPLLSMALAYTGALLVLKRSSLFGFGLIFASHFHLRFLPALLAGASDEVDAVRRTGWLHGSPYAVAVVLFSLALPPLVIAQRALKGRWKWAVFAVAYLLPLAVPALSDQFDVLFAEPHPRLPTLALVTWLNVPLLMLVMIVVFTIALVLIAKLLAPSALIVRLAA